MKQRRFFSSSRKTHATFGSRTKICAPAWGSFSPCCSTWFRTRRSELPAAAMLDQLTPREREVLGVLAHGVPDSDIAARLRISEKTARNHVSIIFSKLGITTRAQAVALVRDAGLGVHRKG
jgi:DNA-binding NarL/FixJ family response regulator